MEKTEIHLQEIGKLFFASPQFWLCNIVGWLVFDVAQGFRNSFDGSPFTDNVINYIQTSVLGIIGSLCVHFFYNKFHWHKQHPICLIPTAAWIAIVFGGINTTIHHFDLVISIPEICSRLHPRPPYSCGIISDLFLQSMGAMLIWCLFYFLIQAERKNCDKVSCNLSTTGKALLYLFTLNHLGTFLSVIAYVDWGETYYLFSRDYFVGMFGLILPVLSTAYIFYIKPEAQILGSRTLPLIPTVIVMSICCAILNIGAGQVISRLANFQIDFSVYYILLGSSYGNFNNAGQLAGTLEGSIVSALSITLFFLSYRHAPHRQKNTMHFLTKVNINKTLSSWSFHFLFWLFFGVLLYATDLMSWSEFGDSIPLIGTIAFAVTGFFVGEVLRLQVHYFFTQQTSTVTIALKIVASSIFSGVLLTSVIWLLNYIYIFVILMGFGIEDYANFVNIENLVFASILSSCILCGLWSFICCMVASLHFQRDSTIKQLQLERNMKEVQLNTLAGKIDPHFIFNALNNIRALIDEDSEKARTAVAVLSDILRSPITNNSQDKISVTEEMFLVRNYIFLSKIQYEDRLNYKEDVSEEAHSALIPAMMLQILVENAIKHGISQLPDGGVLSLQIQKHEQHLICTITNHGNFPLNSRTAGFGVGITAIHERLLLLYGNPANFSLQETNNTVVAKLTLPFESSI